MGRRRGHLSYKSTSEPGWPGCQAARAEEWAGRSGRLGTYLQRYKIDKEVCTSKVTLVLRGLPTRLADRLDIECGKGVYQHITGRGKQGSNDVFWLVR